MQLKSFFQTMNDGTEIWTNRWIPDEDVKIKAVIQLHHGLEEHSLRYDAFGSFLTEKGYVLNAYDMRGHGKTAENAQEKGTGIFGKIADKKGSYKVIEDLDQIIENVKKDYPEVPVILFGHSFGSFVSQGYIEEHGDKLKGCILCGTAGPMLPLTTAGKIFASILNVFESNKKSKILASMAFDPYLKRIEKVESGKEWVCKNEMARSMYLDDKWCAFGLTTSFFKDLSTLLCRIHKDKNMKKIPKDLPVNMIYGSEDPVGAYGESINRLYKIYEGNGMTNLSIKAYEGDRHEILNEDDRYTVMEEIVAWFNGVLGL